MILTLRIAYIECETGKVEGSKECHTGSKQSGQDQIATRSRNNKNVRWGFMLKGSLPGAMKALVAGPPGTFVGSDALRFPEHIVPHDLEMLIEVVGVPGIEVKPCRALRANASHFTHSNVVMLSLCNLCW